MKLNLKQPVTKGFSNPLALKDYYNKLRAIGANFSYYDAIRRDITERFNKHVDQVIGRDLNLNCEIVGKGGEGKSLVETYVSQKLKEAQVKYKKNENAPIVTTHNVDQTTNIIKNGPNGTIILQDEYNELVGESTDTKKKRFNNLIRSMRFTQKCFLLCNIDFVYIKGLHFVLETWGFDDSYYLDKDDSKMRTAALVRYVDDDAPHKKLYLGTVFLEVNEALEQYRSDLRLKYENWERLEKFGGGASAHLHEQQRIEYAKMVLKVAKEKGWNGKKGSLNKYFHDAGISVDTAEKAMIIDEAMKLKRSKIEACEVEFDENALLNDDCSTYFQDYYKKELTKEALQDNFVLKKHLKVLPKIAGYWVAGYSLSEMASNVRKDPNLVKRIVDIFTRGDGIPLILRFEYAYESYISSKTRNCVNDGAKGRPDFLFLDEKFTEFGVGEVKIFNQVRNQITIYLQNRNNTKSLRPSTEWCNKNDVRFFPLFFRMNKWKDRTGKVQDFLIIVDAQGNHTVNISKLTCFERYKWDRQFDPGEFFSSKYQESLMGKAINSEEGS